MDRLKSDGWLRKKSGKGSKVWEWKKKQSKNKGRCGIVQPGSKGTLECGKYALAFRRDI